MQAFVANLTAALLFIHTVFGCCWHHAHRCEHGRAVVRKQPAEDQPAKCCHHRDDSGSEQQETPCKGKTGCEGTCTYVVPQKVSVEAPQWVAVELLAALPSLSDSQLNAAACWDAVSTPPDLAPPLRIHLLHQVLLN